MILLEKLLVELYLGGGKGHFAIQLVPYILLAQNYIRLDPNPLTAWSLDYLG